MAMLQAIILTLLVTIISSLFGITSEKEKDFLYEEFNKVLFAEEAETVEGIWVKRVVDGDTIVIVEDGIESKVRLLGIDTPETVDPRREIECFGKEASKKTTELLLNKTIELKADSSQGDSDKYGRLLRYVFLENGKHINLELIELGYAHEYTYNTPYKYQEMFKKAESKAKENELGLWGEICNFNENG